MNRLLAQVHHHQPASPIVEMQRLYSVGHNLIPLGGGDDGKSPLTAFQGRKRLPFGVVQPRMNSVGSLIYGIRLGGMIVVDADTANTQTSKYIKERFGHSYVQVKSPRGSHHYFKCSNAKIPKRVREPNVSIDFKSGENCYVAGAGSVRPDGGQYIADIGVLDTIAQLPAFTDKQPDTTITASNLVPVGQRYLDFMLPRAIEYAPMHDTVDGVFSELRQAVDCFCEHPETVTDAEITKLSKWAWNKRLNNSLWGGVKSAVKTYQDEFEALMLHKNGSDALALLHCLRHNHSGSKRAGKPFPVGSEAMARDQVITGWSASKFHRAKVTLETAGLIQLASKGYSKRNSDGSVTGIASTYLFASLRNNQGKRGSSYLHFTGETRSISKIAGSN